MTWTLCRRRRHLKKKSKYALRTWPLKEDQNSPSMRPVFNFLALACACPGDCIVGLLRAHSQICSENTRNSKTPINFMRKHPQFKKIFKTVSYDCFRLYGFPIVHVLWQCWEPPSLCRPGGWMLASRSAACQRLEAPILLKLLKSTLKLST